VRNPLGYLRVIARRVAGAIYGTERTYQHVLERFASESALTRNSPLLPDARVENGHWQRTLAKALATLPPKHRSYLFFHEFRGMSREDAARAAGLSLAAAEKARSRALEKLAHLLRHWRPLNLRNGDKQ
jgi:DNA-directed RNA polymerase specialized sigma24 family protein